MSQSDKCWREENSPRLQYLTDEQPKMGQHDQRAEIKGRGKWGGLSCSDSCCRSRSDDEIIRVRAGSCELRTRCAEAAMAAVDSLRLVSRRCCSARFGAAANLQRDKVNPCPNLVTPRLIFFRDDLHSECYLTPKPYVTDSQGGRGLL